VSLVEQVVAVNDARKRKMAEKVIKACGGSVAGKVLAILGLAFKPNTDDMREAPSLTIIPALQAAGAEIRAYDPEGMNEAKKLLSGVAFASDAYAAMQGADAAVLLTEWNEFRALDLERAKLLLKSPTLIDLRNVYKPADMAAAGFFYFSIGRRPVEPARADRRVQGART
jgi:UDPglucose 6-dehydrogenase